MASDRAPGAITAGERDSLSDEPRRGVFPAPGHDHHRCIDQALARAERVCRRRGVRLTAGRRRVLETVAASHRAIGAYEIIERMARRGRRPAPVTVYRALEFLIEQGLVHRIESRNAYVSCAAAHGERPAVLFICSGCGTVGEVDDRDIVGAISTRGARIGFDATDATVEVEGRCLHCREGR